jgi:hypothetical protein
MTMTLTGSCTDAAVGATGTVGPEVAAATMRGLDTASEDALRHSGRQYVAIGDLTTENCGRLGPVTIA